jgi:hypothetical protein
MAFLATTSSNLWHHRLGHLGHQSTPLLHSTTARTTNKTGSFLCHACQLGKHVRLPFSLSQSFTTRLFELLHCDLWTSPIPSTSCFGYYLVIIDDYSHYFCIFPLCKKSDVIPRLLLFMPLSPLTLIFPSSLSNVTMVKNLTV